MVEDVAGLDVICAAAGERTTTPWYGVRLTEGAVCGLSILEADRLLREHGPLQGMIGVVGMNGMICAMCASGRFVPGHIVTRLLGGTADDGLCWSFFGYISARGKEVMRSLMAEVRLGGTVVLTDSSAGQFLPLFTLLASDRPRIEEWAYGFLSLVDGEEDWLPLLRKEQCMLKHIRNAADAFNMTMWLDELDAIRNSGDLVKGEAEAAFAYFEGKWAKGQASPRVDN